MTQDYDVIDISTDYEYPSDQPTVCDGFGMLTSLLIDSDEDDVNAGKARINGGTMDSEILMKSVSPVNKREPGHSPSAKNAKQRKISLSPGKCDLELFAETLEDPAEPKPKVSTCKPLKTSKGPVKKSRSPLLFKPTKISANPPEDLLDSNKVTDAVTPAENKMATSQPREDAPPINRNLTITPESGACSPVVSVAPRDALESQVQCETSTVEPQVSDVPTPVPTRTRIIKLIPLSTAESTGQPYKLVRLRKRMDNTFRVIPVNPKTPMSAAQISLKFALQKNCPRPLKTIPKSPNVQQKPTSAAPGGERAVATQKPTEKVPVRYFQMKSTAPSSSEINGQPTDVQRLPVAAHVKPARTFSSVGPSSVGVPKVVPRLSVTGEPRLQPTRTLIPTTVSQRSTQKSDTRDPQMQPTKSEISGTPNILRKSSEKGLQPIRFTGMNNPKIVYLPKPLRQPVAEKPLNNMGINRTNKPQPSLSVPIPVSRQENFVEWQRKKGFPSNPHPILNYITKEQPVKKGSREPIKIITKEEGFASLQALLPKKDDTIFVENLPSIFAKPATSNLRPVRAHDLTDNEKKLLNLPLKWLDTQHTTENDQKMEQSPASTTKPSKRKAEHEPLVWDTDSSITKEKGFASLQAVLPKKDGIRFVEPSGRFVPPVLEKPATSNVRPVRAHDLTDSEKKLFNLPLRGLDTEHTTENDHKMKQSPASTTKSTKRKTEHEPLAWDTDSSKSPQTVKPEAPKKPQEPFFEKPTVSLLGNPAVQKVLLQEGIKTLVIKKSDVKKQKRSKEQELNKLGEKRPKIEEPPTKKMVLSSNVALGNDVDNAKTIVIKSNNAKQSTGEKKTSGKKKPQSSGDEEDGNDSDSGADSDEEARLRKRSNYRPGPKSKRVFMYEKDNSYKPNSKWAENVPVGCRLTRQQKQFDEGIEQRKNTPPVATLNFEQMADVVVSLKRLTSSDLRKLNIRGFKASPRLRHSLVEI